MARSDPRRLALRILAQAESGNVFVDELLDEALRKHALSRQDAALLHELTLGTVRHRRRLDHALDRLCRKGLDSLPAPLLPILRMALYQMMFLSRVPRHAIVDEAVKAAKQSRAAGLSGLANALLRAVPESPALLPVMADSPVQRMGIEHSFPDFLVERWLAELGEAETEALLAALNHHPELSIRVNLDRATPQEYFELLAVRKIAARPDPLCPTALRLPPGTRVRELPGYEEGLFSVQDSAAMLVGELCAAPAGGCVLDACAAPGGKTLQLAAQVGRQGRVYALDASYGRLARLRENMARAGAAQVEVRQGDARRLPPEIPAGLDLALADVPCSGLGTLRRRADLRWRLAPEDIPRLAGLAGEILAGLAERIRPGGVLVYATCTLTREENGAVVKAFLATRPDAWQREDARRFLPAAAHVHVNPAGELVIWPHRADCDGAFAARLRRIV